MGCYQTLEEHSAPITALDFTEPYGTLVTAGQDDIVRVWDLCDGQEIGRLRGHTGGITSPLDEEIGTESLTVHYHRHCQSSSGRRQRLLDWWLGW
jgi:WD40 repeat protein